MYSFCVFYAEFGPFYVTVAPGNAPCGCWSMTVCGSPTMRKGQGYRDEYRERYDQLTDEVHTQVCPYTYTRQGAHYHNITCCFRTDVLNIWRIIWNSKVFKCTLFQFRTIILLFIAFKDLYDTLEILISIVDILCYSWQSFIWIKLTLLRLLIKLPGWTHNTSIRNYVCISRNSGRVQCATSGELTRMGSTLFAF